MLQVKKDMDQLKELLNSEGGVYQLGTFLNEKINRGDLSDDDKIDAKVMISHIVNLLLDEYKQ